MPTKDAILEALKVVIDPELHRNIVELGMVRNIDDPRPGCRERHGLADDPRLPDQRPFPDRRDERRSSPSKASPRVNVGFDVLSDQEKQGLQRTLGRPQGLPEGALAQVANVVCIGSGKGGVGKSTLTVNLAAALARRGQEGRRARRRRVGLQRPAHARPRRPAARMSRPRRRSSRSSRTASKSSRSASSSRRTRRSCGAARCSTRRSPSSSRTWAGASSTTC